MRFLFYALAPVPIALLGLLGLYAVLALALPESGTFLSLLGPGYAALGMQSVLFALAMRWLEPRCAAAVRAVLAALLGTLCGGSLLLLDWALTGAPPPNLLFPVLGAFAGLTTSLLAGLLPGGGAKRRA